MSRAEVVYRYQRASTLRPDGGLLLATSGGTAPHGALESPRFFDGFIAHAEQAAVALRVCARVARTRFYVPPGMLAAVIRAADPVVTSSGDRLRFESFSACCGVYARLDVLPGALDGAMPGTGTTNVYFNPPMREALARIGGIDPLHLSVGVDDVTVRTMDGEVVERRVPLPERWLKGFAEVPPATAGMTRAAELGGPAARSFLRGLPRSWRGPAWATPLGRSLRISPRAGRGAVCASGPDRLRVLEPLARFATALRVYGGAGPAGRPAASAWELVCRDLYFVVVLSPEVNRGFSGEGAVLTDLADERAEDDAGEIAPLLSWETRLDPGRLAAETGMSRDRVLRALSRLGAAGRVGYDLADECYFHRELPYDPDVLDGMHPRLRDARALAESGAVVLVDGGALVRGGDVEHRVSRGPDGDTCTCPWWGRHRGGRGPCKHVLAADLAGRP
ncbi:SWIM zinc finger domain-containing protein [Actinomadura sp. HBU206391]|uniref:SWIM zinc finger family protein n=1 Tax=Actinomadura sp. HBU206391 TaxID=2731692 RepID=UPI00164F550C|nr:SWIM zinc finger family protein [Actinomadura sp. HBU206391]MBC6463379.1 SWIM zinc finger family protein [Actinomadura sp. HBU206391]